MSSTDIRNTHTCVPIRLETLHLGAEELEKLPRLIQGSLVSCHLLSSPLALRPFCLYLAKQRSTCPL